ncbi:hypothetical protein AB0G85_37120 [Streptomyces sioyaensis]|uniref:hypothetical protein n=1 Tax=Streptomyces sioyaensis TaxID=67364 RepID=UPI0033FC3D9F
MIINDPDSTGDVTAVPADMTYPLAPSGPSPLELSWEFFRQADDHVLDALARFFEARGMDPKTSTYWFLDMLCFAAGSPDTDKQETSSYNNRAAHAS